VSAQITRLLKILDMLPRFKKSLSVNQIHSKLYAQDIDVTIRTIQRDMGDLEAVFKNRLGMETHSEFYQRTHHDPTADTDKSNRWYWSSKSPTIYFAGLTVSQGLSLALIKKHLPQLFPKTTLDELEPLFQEAARTLKTHYESPLVEWPKKIAIVQPTQPLLMPQIKPEIQTIVTEALLTDRQIHIDYRHSNGVLNGYELNPLGLVLRNGSLYLIATEINNNEKPRPFVLHRISRAEPFETLVVRSKDFDLQRYIDEGYMGFNYSGQVSYQPILFKGVFDAITANHLSESALSIDQVIERLDDEHFMISATVQDTEQLFWWLQSLGGRVEVLEPVVLRNKMIESVKVLVERYQINKGS